MCQKIAQLPRAAYWHKPSCAFVVLSIYLWRGKLLLPPQVKLASLPMSQPRKVLVAEDSSVIQNITKKVLQSQNYEIVSVKNGQEVLNYLENNTCGVILLDINMPVMDGMECARQVRQLADPQKSTIPIVAITGNAKNYTLDEFKAVGIGEYLQKPINFDLLVETVTRIMAS
jgi:CheY-like chemotaxis protein